MVKLFWHIVGNSGKCRILRQGQTQNITIMKTKLQTKALTIALGALALITFITFNPASANNEGQKKSKMTISVEDSLTVEELLVEINSFDLLEELEFSVNNAPKFQVFDANDKLLFSGNQKQWGNHKNKELVMIKRKAEYLFESDGTQIYKIF